jgi:hypothetical protein
MRSLCVENFKMKSPCGGGRAVQFETALTEAPGGNALGTGQYQQNLNLPAQKSDKQLHTIRLRSLAAAPRGSSHFAHFPLDGVVRRSYDSISTCYRAVLYISPDEKSSKEENMLRTCQN